MKPPTPQNITLMGGYHRAIRVERGKRLTFPEVTDSTDSKRGFRDEQN